MDPKNKKTIKGAELDRSVPLSFERADDEKRQVPAAISTEAVVKRWFGNEKLIHSDKAINLDRAAEGLPLLFNHDRDKPIGRADNVRLEDGVLRADLAFSNNDLATTVFRDVQEKFLRDVSLGYRIERYKDIKGGIEATRWQPFEVSIATVPADYRAGINRQQDDQGVNMDPKEKDGKTIVEGVNENHALGINEGMKQEQERQNAIRGIFVNFKDNDKAVEAMNRCLSDYRISTDTARAELLDLLSAGFEPTAKATNTKLERGEDETDKFFAAATDSLMVRTGLETDPKVADAVRQGELGSFGLKQLAIEFLRRANYSVAGGDPAVIGRALSMGGDQYRVTGAHSSSDFPALLENVANKSMAKGFMAIEQTWRQWAGIGSVSDFKQTNFVTLSEFSDLELKPEGAEYKHGTYKDKKEVLGIDTHGKMFAITREAIINDDLGALARIPQGMGQAAGRSIEALVYAVFLANPTLLETGLSVWNAGHSNIGTGGAISEVLLDALRQLMASQKGVLNQAGKTKSKASTQLLNIPAKSLLVPKALELTANKLMVTEYATDALNDPNMIRGAFDVVASPYLDVDSTTAYYLMADPNMYDTVMVAFLNGVQSPYLEAKNGWNVDGVEYKVRIDVGAAWLDFRGTAKNAGA